MIRIEKLTKAFKGKPALRGVSMQIERGEIYGMLGHNGAGKSTTFGIMLGQVYPDSGEVLIDGVSVQRDRSRALAKVGAIFEAPGFYNYLSGWRNLQILTSYSARVPAAELREAVEIVGLTPRIHDKVGTYSHGMRQRLALAQALVPAPELVMLDEPTEGLDPAGIHEIRELIQRLNRERGLTVIFSSHLLAEVEQLCTRVAILHQGALLFEGPWSELQHPGQQYRLDLDDWSRAQRILAAHHARIVSPQIIELADHRDIADLVADLTAAGLRLRALEPQRRSLETLYLEAIAHPSTHGVS
ncbi:MAG TPA: ABC transporter ATP-binding protein [Chthoniobacteraceae bacterium]|jgi:ABC-2 type transport system ATP-binding protein|nr:ABC transporter ATP-binding protein [Chthoniobacteraceae bacterium]